MRGGLAACCYVQHCKPANLAQLPACCLPSADTLADAILQCGTQSAHASLPISSSHDSANQSPTVGLWPQLAGLAVAPAAVAVASDQAQQLGWQPGSSSPVSSQNPAGAAVTAAVSSPAAAAGAGGAAAAARAVAAAAAAGARAARPSAAVGPGPAGRRPGPGTRTAAARGAAGCWRQPRRRCFPGGGSPWTLCCLLMRRRSFRSCWQGWCRHTRRSASASRCAAGLLGVLLLALAGADQPAVFATWLGDTANRRHCIVFLAACMHACLTSSCFQRLPSGACPS